MFLDGKYFSIMVNLHSGIELFLGKLAEDIFLPGLRIIMRKVAKELES